MKPKTSINHIKSITKRPLKVKGFRAAGVSVGIKPTRTKDLALIVSDLPARVAGVFTTNRVKASSIDVDIVRTKSGRSKGVIINSGNANACTGKAGIRATDKTLKTIERELGLKSGEMLVSSTGVIGVPLDVSKIERGIPKLVKALSTDGFTSAAEAIMTTDASMKTISGKVQIGDEVIIITAIAKGAGMIRPDMATMLAYFMTDANISVAALRKALKSSVDGSFNRITVDGGMSTNDTALIFANGAAGGELIKPASSAYKKFAQLLNELALRLAHMIVRDGEGATKFVELTVKGAASAMKAERAARSLAESILVKTALFGGDPNWGRIIAELGSIDVSLNPEKTDIEIGGVKVFARGVDTGKETAAARVMKKRDVELTGDLKSGKGTYTLWTTDLSYGYVKLNSQYRT